MTARIASLPSTSMFDWSKGRDIASLKPDSMELRSELHFLATNHRSQDNYIPRRASNAESNPSFDSNDKSCKAPLQMKK
jgi:hypothetical protein